MISPHARRTDLRPSAWIAVLFFCAALSAAWLRFSPWFPGVLFGDDLFNYAANLHGNFPGNIKSAALTTFENKYRPVFHFSLGSLFRIFGKNVYFYMIVNWLLHALNASLVGLLAWRLSRASLLIGLISTVAVSSSRFALYQVTQVTGFIEGLAFTGGLIAVVLVTWIRDTHNEKTARRLAIASVAAAALVLHVHERYIVLYPWLIICFWALSNTGKLKQIDFHLAALSLILIGAGNYFIRTKILHVPYFMGTGGQQIQIGAEMVMKHLTQALASLLGFNHGPEYLAAIDLADLPLTPRVYAAIFALTAIAIPLRHIYVNFKWSKSIHGLLWPILFVLLICFLLLPAISTVRLEQRWLLAPQACLIFLMADACGSTPTKPENLFRVGAVTIALLSVLILDTYISTRFDRLFFVYSARTAESVKSQLDQGLLLTGTSRLVLDLREEHCRWTLGNGSFFEIYSSGARQVTCTKP